MLNPGLPADRPNPTALGAAFGLPSATAAASAAAARLQPSDEGATDAVQTRMRVLAVIDNSDGRFCCLAEKLARLTGAGVVLDVVFTESCWEFCAYVDVMGVNAGDMAASASGRAPLDGLRAALVARGLAGRVDLRSLGRIGLHALFDGGIATSHYDLILFDEQAPSPFSYAGGTARRLADSCAIPVVHVRRCDPAGGSGRARASDGDDRTALMAVWPGGEGAALLRFLARYADTFSAIVIWIDDKADIERTGRAALDDGLRRLNPAIPIEIYHRRDRFRTSEFTAAIERHKIGSIFVPPMPRPGGLGDLWRKLRLRLLSARGDLSRIYVGV